MKAIIIGAGKIGFNIAQTLSQEGHDVYVVEKDEERQRRQKEAERKANIRMWIFMVVMIILPIVVAILVVSFR